MSSELTARSVASSAKRAGGRGTMLIVNLYHIKKTNGLFYYGVEYVKTGKHVPHSVLVRREMAEPAARHFGKSRVVPCTLLTYLLRVFSAWFSGWMIFTPSSHPLPLVNRQLVILHDTYPFEGKLGWLKKWLFVLSARTSRCWLGYINQSEGLAFYRKCRFDENRLVFAPNKFPVASGSLHVNALRYEKRLRVGLVGTDSRKKNYPDLFRSVFGMGRSMDVTFAVYGHATDYFLELQHMFTSLDIRLVKSDESTLEEFLSQLDVLVSVARSEGFGRPIASALMSGIPCYLLDGPVFREFYSGGANFSADVPQLVKTFFDDWSRGALKTVSFRPPIAVMGAFDRAAAVLQKYGGSSVE